MILGIGTDIVQIQRIEAILAKYGTLFKSKILNELELQYLTSVPLSKHTVFLAKRFAAKEAISKAFGTGIGSFLQFRDITIINNKLGKPIVEINSSKLSHLHSLQIDLSLTDDYPIAVAFAIISIQKITKG